MTTRFEQEKYQLLGREDKSEQLLDLISKNDLPGVTKMLDEGADVNLSPLNSVIHIGETPLVTALKYYHHDAMNINPEMIRLIIKRGADVNDFVGGDISLSDANLLSRNTSRNGISFLMIEGHEYYEVSGSFNYKHGLPFSNAPSHIGGYNAPKKGGREVAKLLISNGASISHCIQGEKLSDEFIADVFLPRAIALADNDKMLLEYSPSDPLLKSMNKLPDDMLRKINTEHMPLFTQLLQQLCDIDGERAHTIHKLIVDKIENLNSDQLALQRSYILRDNNLLATLSDTVFARIIGPIRKTEALDPAFKGSQFKTTFAAVFKGFMSDKAVANFQIEGREKMLQMAQQIAEQNAGQKNLTPNDLKIIFAVILAIATNDQQRASKILEPLRNQSDKVYISQLFDMVKKHQKSQRWF